MPIAFGNNSRRPSPSDRLAAGCIALISGLGTQEEPKRSQRRASSASSTVCFVLVPKKRLGSDAAPQQRLRRSNPGQEIFQLLSGTLPLPAWGLGASQHLINSGSSQEQAGLFLEGNPSLARVPARINMHFWVILKDNGSVGQHLTLGFCMCQRISIHNMIAVSGKAAKGPLFIHLMAPFSSSKVFAGVCHCSQEP